MRIGIIRPGEELRAVAIHPDDEGSYLSAMQELVGGRIEFFDVLFGDEPALIVNDDGIAEGLPANRAIWATREMEATGYLSQLDYSTPVKEGDFYAILFGTILAVAYDEDGSARDITEAELGKVRAAIGEERHVTSGIEAAMAIRAGYEPPSASEWDFLHPARCQEPGMEANDNAPTLGEGVHVASDAAAVTESGPDLNELPTRNSSAR